MTSDDAHDERGDEGGEQVDPDHLYVMMLDLLVAQGSKFIEPMLRAHHHSRGNRLFTLMTLIVVLPGLDQALAHSNDVASCLEDSEKLHEVAFLMRRGEADLEIAIEALLVGRQSLVSDAMRDVMEIEMLFRDFVGRPDNIGTWINADSRTVRNKFSPREVRRRIANDLFPGKGYDLPEADEYAVHSAVLHPNPHRTPRRDKPRDPTMHDGKTLLEAGEVLEHAHRLFVAADALIHATSSVPAPPPPSDLGLLIEARNMWIDYAQQLKDNAGLPPRGPRPRGTPNPLLDPARPPEEDEG